MKAEILLALEHRLTSQAIHALLADAPCVGEIRTCRPPRSLLDCVNEAPPDVAILEVTSTADDALNGIRALRRAAPGVRTIAILPVDERRVAAHALEAGASGIIVSGSPAQVLPNAIDSVLRGAVYICPNLQKALGTRHGANLLRAQHVRSPLSSREREVVQLIANGMSTPDIAAYFDLSTKTIATYRMRIAEKTGARSVAEITRYAIRERLTSL